MMRAASFLLGMFLVWVAVYSPLADYDHHLLTVHMIQHVLLMTVAPPLILLAHPLVVFDRLLPPPAQRLARVPSRRLALCWTVSTLALVGWHVPALLTMAMKSDVWHSIEQGSFLAAGLLFWWPVVQPWPSSSTERPWSIVLYLFLATLPCDVLSGLLVFSERIAYPMYLSAPRHASVSVLDDQQRAGALMWTAVTIIYVVAGVIVAMRSLSRSSLRVNERSTLPVACDLRAGLVP
jgi:putative membrane protein